jgi:hypothetical protein
MRVIAGRSKAACMAGQPRSRRGAERAALPSRPAARREAFDHGGRRRRLRARGRAEGGGDGDGRARRWGSHGPD